MRSRPAAGGPRCFSVRPVDEDGRHADGALDLPNDGVNPCVGAEALTSNVAFAEDPRRAVRLRPELAWPPSFDGDAWVLVTGAWLEVLALMSARAVAEGVRVLDDEAASPELRAAGDYWTQAEELTSNALLLADRQEVELHSWLGQVPLDRRLAVSLAAAEEANDLLELALAFLVRAHALLSGEVNARGHDQGSIRRPKDLAVEARIERLQALAKSGQEPMRCTARTTRPRARRRGRSVRLRGPPSADDVPLDRGAAA